jgi:adenine-specific DNA-methyltransferase
MEKLKMSTPDLTDKNIEQIGALFPNVITETRDENGSVKKAVDFDLLKQVLSKDLVEDDNERYRLDWPGKKASLLKANTPITKTLRPYRKGSVNFDTTENLYIEGDNFEVLKILQESYLGKIKMIYIDPPYNTGNDFIYKDNFAKSKEEYEEELGTTDEDGGKLFRNTDSNGRYHSDWLSMMYERLVVARDLLKDDGVIFISIDDNEVHNLRKICDEVFGEENFLACMVLLTGANQSGDGVKIQTNTENCVVYSKSNDIVDIRRIDKVNETLRNLNDAPTPLETRPDMGYSIYYNPQSGDFKPVKDYDKEKIYLNEESEVYTDDPELLNEGYLPIRPGVRNLKLHRWRWGFDTFIERKDEIEIKTSNENYAVCFKQSGFNSPKNVLQFGSGTSEVKNLFGGMKIFDFPKGTNYISRLVSIGTANNDIILDFFSGSATTAHAVMQLNAEDGGNRKFIMVQLPELCDKNSEAFKAGYKTIAHIGRERIRRAGKKIVEELTAKNQQLNLGEEPVEASKLDIGFRVYKTDTTNMKDVFYHPSELKQDLLSDLESNIKEDRTSEDILTQVILDLGLELTLPIETKQILDNTVFIVQTNALVACFDNDIDFKIVDAISDLKPLKVVFKDASFKDDKDRINVEERFKRLSPETRVTVI